MATLQAFQSLRDLSLVLEREPKVAVTLGIIGLERDGLAVGSHRLIDSTRVSKGNPEAVVGVRIIGLQLHGAPASDDCLVELALLVECQAKLQVSHEIIRLQANRLPVGDDRLVQPPGPDQLVAQVEPRPRAVGTQRRRRGQKTNGLVILRRLVFSQRDPQVVVEPEVRRESLLGPSQQRQCSRTGPSLYQTLA